MRTSLAENSNITLREWVDFFSVLNNTKKEGNSILKKVDAPSRIVNTLEKEFSKIQQPAIFRRLGKHTQLALHFS